MILLLFESRYFSSLGVVRVLQKESSQPNSKSPAQLPLRDQPAARKLSGNEWTEIRLKHLDSINLDLELELRKLEAISYYNKLRTKLPKSSVQIPATWVLVFSCISTTLVCLNMVHTGYTEPIGQSGCLPGQPDHFGGSHAMITQHFENSQKSVFGRTLVLVLGMKDSKSRLIPTCSKLSDLRAL
jgi:hypothetical protein